MEKPKTRVVSSAVTDKGLSDKRPVNEDSYLEMPERGLFAVADGVGGAQAGDFASQTAMEVLQEAFSHPQQNLDTEELLEMAVQRANESIFQMAHELPQFEMMATTIVALQIEGNVATMGHVGDSRIYRIDPQGNLFRETNDHSMVEEEVRAGRMTAVQAAHHPSRNVISRALGSEAVVEVEMKTMMFEFGTTFMLCSDGVTHHLADHEIRELFGRLGSPTDVCSEIKAICYSRGAEDNLTAIVVRVENAALPVEEDEATMAGVRPVFAPDPLPALSNGAGQQRGASLTEASSRPDEFVAVDNALPPVTTAPLKPLPDGAAAENNAQTILKPASQTIGVSGETINPAASQPTLERKAENERLRSKVDAAPPFNEYSEPQSSGYGKLFNSIILLLLGALIGAGGYYAWMLMNPPQTAAPTVQPANTIAPINSNNDMSPQEINEFRMFEKVRRTVDSDPNAAQTTFNNPQSAADYYLRGRANLLLGNNEAARKDFNKAEEVLTPGDEGVNRETLKTDIAIGQAAVGAMTLTREDRRMLEEQVKTKQGGANIKPTQPVR